MARASGRGTQASAYHGEATEGRDDELCGCSGRSGTAALLTITSYVPRGPRGHGCTRAACSAHAAYLHAHARIHSQVSLSLPSALRDDRSVQI
eukprot:scaffold29747_cov107-Isochrysis_galbana.AAC.1